MRLSKHEQCSQGGKVLWVGVRDRLLEGQHLANGNGEEVEQVLL